MVRVNMDFEVANEKQLSRFFDVAGDGVADFTEVFEAWGSDFKERQHSVFVNEGAFEGRQRWASLSGKYAEWKSLHYPGTNILERTGRMWNSLISQSHTDHIYKATDEEFKIGTSVPYAVFHQEGTSNMPQRKIIQLTEPQRTEWSQICRQVIWDRVERQASIYDIRHRG